MKRNPAWLMAGLVVFGSFTLDRESSR